MVETMITFTISIPSKNWRRPCSWRIVQLPLLDTKAWDALETYRDLNCNSHLTYNLLALTAEVCQEHHPVSPMAGNLWWLHTELLVRQLNVPLCLQWDVEGELQCQELVFREQGKSLEGNGVQQPSILLHSSLLCNLKCDLNRDFCMSTIMKIIRKFEMRWMY